MSRLPTRLAVSSLLQYGRRGTDHEVDAFDAGASGGNLDLSVEQRAGSRPWPSAKAELEAARLEQTTRLVFGDVHDRRAPRVKHLVARLRVGGDGNEASNSTEIAGLD
jgi:hypothetical protein